MNDAGPAHVPVTSTNPNAPSEPSAESAATPGPEVQSNQNAAITAAHAGREAVEFVSLALIIALLLVTFIAQPYFVPSGSMATTLLGLHLKATCDQCGATVFVGVDRSGVPGAEESDCHICGSDSVPVHNLDVSGGDQLIVQKGAYDFRLPRRWEIVVFKGPDEPREAFVKRVGGLPGESVEVKYGDLLINGEVAKKSFDDFLRMAIPVYDQSKAGDRAVHHRDLESGETEWWFALMNERQEEVPFRDVVGYNAGKNDYERDPVRDFLITADVRLAADEANQNQELIVTTGVVPGHELRWLFAGSGGQLNTVAMNQDDKQLEKRSREIKPGDPTKKSPARIMLAFWDGKMTAAIDGFRFGETSVDPALLEIAPSSNPRVVTFRGKGLELSNLRVWRDVYYTRRIGGGRGTAVDEPFKLGPDEFFMLGDNSAISRDSRAWELPIVKRSQLVGKPILVHWPLKAWRPSANGRPFQLPDLSRIRFLDDIPLLDLDGNRN